MEEIFEILRNQIKGNFDQDDIIILLDKSIHRAKVIRTK